MKARFPAFLSALVIGIIATLVFTVAAFLSHGVGAEFATRVLSWPNTLLQSLVSPLNIGTPEKPLYEGTVLNVLAYFASFLLSIAVYTLAAYIVIRRRHAVAGRGTGSDAEAGR
jgi:hypothetical protein